MIFVHVHKHILSITTTRTHGRALIIYPFIDVFLK